MLALGLTTLGVAAVGLGAWVAAQFLVGSVEDGADRLADPAAAAANESESEAPERRDRPRNAAGTTLPQPSLPAAVQVHLVNRGHRLVGRSR